MKYAIVSDVHANSVALERVLADAEPCGVEQVVCAGDVVGYGPDPAEGIRILRERGISTVMGKHDRAGIRLRWLRGCASGEVHADASLDGSLVGWNDERHGHTVVNW